MMRRILLLPSARLLPLEPQVEFGEIPSAMVPLGSRPALHYIAEQYVRNDFHVVVSVHSQSDQVKRYVARHPELRASTIDVGHTESLGETILRTLETLNETDQLVINFADTFVADPLAGGNTVCYSQLDDVFRWTTFELDDERTIIRIVDKNQRKNTDGPLPVFVGVFAMDRAREFEVELSRALDRDAGIDPFYTAVQAYFNNLGRDEKSFQLVSDWRDFGHLDTYYFTKRAFGLNHRSFNSLILDGQRRTVRKSSSDVDKLSGEIQWYLKLPRDLAYIAPRVFDYSLDGAASFVELEFYAYPTLSDIYLFGDCETGLWRRIFRAVEWTMREMRLHRDEAADAVLVRSAMKEMYEDKTRKKLEQIAGREEFKQLSGFETRINGRTCFGILGVLERLPSVISSVNLYAQDHVAVIHGDLCLANILYDRRNDAVRLIDPRGRFGSFDTHGDPRYDLAKLSHSIEGDYDFLLNDLFDLACEGGDVRLRPHIDDRHEKVKKLFRGMFFDGGRPHEYEAVRLIEGLLFLSMVPLHPDRPRSQIAFLVRGLEIFSSVVEGRFRAMGVSQR